MTLDDVPAATRIFLDSTIFIYHATGASLQCRHLLERCEAGDLKGVTSVVVLAEVAHRLMMVEALTTGLVSGKDVVKKLRQKPDLASRLHVYQEHVERVPLMGVEVVPVDFRVLLRSAEQRRRYGLLVNDSLVVATAQELGIDCLGSADADFRRVEEMKLYCPADLH